MREHKIKKNEDFDRKINRLVSLAIDGLEPLYDPEKKLFTHYILAGKQTPMPDSWVITYSAITLLGLLKTRQADLDVHWFDELEVMGALVQSLEGQFKPGDLGLILWTDAKNDGKHSQVLLEEVKQQTRDGSISQMINSELAWVLTGLSYSKLNDTQDNMVEELANIYYEALKQNFHPETGLFSHMEHAKGRLNIRAQIGSFADQIYSIYALSVYHQAFGWPESKAIALQCADQIYQFQGFQGEWWWHYHAGKGMVASRYPVYATHQNGMGPMGLLKLSEICERDFSAPIQKSMQWLFGDNNLGAEMVEWENNTIWRDIERKAPASYLRYLSFALAVAGLKRPIQCLESVRAFTINKEMRPYQLGWLLYAFADQERHKDVKVK
ncbi:MAG: hypothetical protein PVF83_12040 [Anaerolineales bacterium]|jgi:hypothetical protein